MACNICKLKMKYTRNTKYKMYTKFVYVTISICIIRGVNVYALCQHSNYVIREYSVRVWVHTRMNKSVYIFTTFVLSSILFSHNNKENICTQSVTDESLYEASRCNIIPFTNQYTTPRNKALISCASRLWTCPQ
jgi:hypothetical protein